jgi:alcohol dehydrogenase
MSPLDFTTQLGRFQVASRLIFGNNAVQELPEELPRLGVERPLLITDPGLRRTGIAGRIEGILQTAGFDAQVFDQVEANPSVETVEKALAQYHEHHCDSILALGGGSPIDTAKAVGMLVNNHGSVQDFVGLHTFTNPLPPLIAIPTTVGTGSEATTFAVITDRSVKRKLVIGNPLLAPVLALLDPELTMTLPPRLVASTGLDALTHAVESYLTTVASDFTDAVGLHAARLISTHLERAVSPDRDIETMGHMLHASCLAGMAFSYGRTALVHGMSQPLGACYDVPHGMANSILLPYVMRFNRPACEERLADLGRAMGFAGTGTPDGQAADAFVDGVTDLSQRVGIPKTLSEVGVTDEFIPQMSGDAAESGNAKVNPRVPTVEEVEAIYRSAL